jgi:cell wall assembly regulator SMI1
MGILERAAALREPPREPLAAYLLQLNAVLEALHNLQYRVVDGRIVADEDLAPMRQELVQLAQRGFANAVAARASQVDQWLRGLLPMQRPAEIDFDAWAAKAASTSDPEQITPLPVPSERLEMLIAECRRRRPVPLFLGDPIADEDLRARLDGLGAPLHPDLVAFSRLTRQLILELPPWSIEISELAHGKDPALTLSNSGETWVTYSFAFAADGAVVQTSSFREGSRYTLDTPVKAAAALEAFLEAVLSKERLDAGGAWSPGPLLPLPGVPPKPPPRLTDEQRAQARREHAIERMARSGLPSLEDPDGHAPTVERALQRIEAWVMAHAPELASSLAPPAKPDDLRLLDVFVSGSLPAPVRAWFSCHDGGATTDVALLDLFRGYSFLSIAAALFQRKEMLAMRGEECWAFGPVKATYFHDRWLPFTMIDEDSHFHCLDFDPEPGGNVGQVIRVDDDDLERRVIAPDLGHYLTRFARALERGWGSVTERGIELDAEFCFTDE